MAALYLVVYPSALRAVDAALPQGGALVQKSCQFGHLSAIVHADRTQAVCTSRRGFASCETLQEHRSQKCRAPRSSCRCASLPLWQPARPRKKKSSTSKIRLSRSNRPTPENTSKTFGRASGALSPRPALILSAPQVFATSADNPTARPDRFEVFAPARYAGRAETPENRSIPCGQLPLSPFWLSPHSAPARNPRLNPNRFPSPSSLPRPANTAPDIPERARRGNRQAPVPTPQRAPQHKVRPC